MSKTLKALAWFLAVLVLPLLLGAWRDMTGDTINPRYVERLKDGVTTKHEVLLYFGQPQEVERTPEGQIFKYTSYKDAPATTSKPERKSEVESQYLSSTFHMDEDKKVKKVPLKKQGKIPKSTLTIRFKPDGETMLSHEYREF
jgi:outer membrane protein assembly factor BamE (lipoprotein component of BamABCDE complex)